MEYIIGAGAILESGEYGSITPASLHAQVDATLARRVKAAAIDFESTEMRALQRLIVLAQGWNASTFRSEVSERLRERRECSLADVLGSLARGTGVSEVHLFAHWLPDEETCAQLRAEGIEVVAHPLEAIDAASLVAGQRHRRWHAA